VNTAPSILLSTAQAFGKICLSRGAAWPRSLYLLLRLPGAAGHPLHRGLWPLHRHLRPLHPHLLHPRRHRRSHA